jgi:hypothetical protein
MDYAEQDAKHIFIGCYHIEYVTEGVNRKTGEHKPEAWLVHGIEEHRALTFSTVEHALHAIALHLEDAAWLAASDLAAVKNLLAELHLCATT